jgi:RNA polymerase sigma factor (sigma-70 family)
LSIAFDSPSARPTRQEIEPVALDLIKKRGAEVLAGARRYAPTPDDAEDAYQRALEILLTKAPTTCEDELLPWLKTVVRHECFALRKKRERDIPVEHEELDGYASRAHAAEERAERYDRLRVGAEALGRLKPAETKALLLKAEGMSYREIAAQTGWTYTKVNRCLVEGRRAFVARVEGIESGAECERLAPLLSAVADGEASADDLAVVRPHLRGCPSCKATLRAYREAPAIMRDLSAGVAAAGAFGWLGDRVWSALRSLFETAGAQKAAAVAASTAVVAGGGAATVHVVHQPTERPAAERAAAAQTAPSPTATAPSTHAAPAATPSTAGKRHLGAKPKKRPPRRTAPTAPKALPAAQTQPGTTAQVPQPQTARPAAPSSSAPAPPPPAEPTPSPTAPAGEFGP